MAAPNSLCCLCPPIAHQYRGRTDFHVTPEMMEPLRRTERSLVGYAGSGLAGLGLARYLAHPSRAPRYRPGPVGQLAIISGAALIGGEIMAERSGPCAITQVIDSDKEMGGALCQAAERMGPCASGNNLSTICNLSGRGGGGSLASCTSAPGKSGV
ncbi:hypothetical protein JKP88DRAFT_218767 [Tribonema minus]|uniref:Uncharacterized protein n=1 Tax=Tribonema minus TaxID=303371 RepID=A0A835ZB04_9STRA|nr:hypothetical protein JKP88DRAFT_218767 [Tribonema minus]